MGRVNPIVHDGEDAQQFVLDLHAQHRIPARDVRDFAGQVNALFAALRVLTETPHIRAYLEQHDPKALAQARYALGEPPNKEGAR